VISAQQEKALERFRKNPHIFFKEVLGIDTIEDYQLEALQVIADNERVAISACHDVGKSWLLARVVLWYVTCFPYCKVITTAPTFNQVKNILWSEIRSAYARSKFPLGGKMNLTEWTVTKEGDWFAIGFTPRNELSGGEGQGTQSSFQGFHAPHLLVVYDEATGIPNQVWTMTEGILTSASVKFVAIGNPTSRQSEFFKCFSSPLWSKIKLSCFNSPNLRLNGVTDKESLIAEIDRIRELPDIDKQIRMKSYVSTKPYLLSLKWVINSAMKWGMDHPLFVSKALGEFPEETEGTLIPLGVVESAQLRIAYPADEERKTLGVDVARFGNDSTVLTGLHGKKFLARKQLVKKNIAEVTGAVIAFDKEHGPFDVIVVDETGLGAGVVDMLNEARQGDRPAILPKTEIRGVQFGAACESDEDRERFVNVKARMFRLLADDLKDEDGLCLPENMDAYTDELPTIRYGFDSKGRMVIESKDDYKKRTGRKSPDDADSLALANFGRYDELTVGRFESESHSNFPRPFAASLGSDRPW
jgi:phage terminase large subunit